MALDMVDHVNKEIKRLIEVEFIKLIGYVKWIFNVVPAFKKNNKLMVCVDFKNIRLVTLKDKYHMSMVDILIDATSDNEIFSFINGHSSYNQILIIKEYIFGLYLDIQVH